MRDSHAVEVTARSRRSLHTALAACTALVLVVLAMPAQAYQIPKDPLTYDGTTAVAALPGSGLTTTYSGSGLTSVTGATTLGDRGYLAADYSQGLAATVPVAEITTSGTNNCQPTGPCDGLGGLTIDFGTPVKDPVLSIAALGGFQAAGGLFVTKQSNWHAVLHLTTPGATMTKLSGGNLQVVDNAITTIDDNSSPDCSTNRNIGDGGAASMPSTSTAGCGTVQVHGTVQSLTFDITGVFVRTVATKPPLSCLIVGTGCLSTNGDTYLVVASADEDFGDAPASYDQGDAARAVISDVAIGANVTADNATIANAVVSPYRNGGQDTGDDMTLPALAVGAASYSVTVPITGAGAPGTVCGWVDLNRNGVFDATEKACATFASGAASAVLSWPALPGLTAGDTWARFRIGYDDAQIQSPTGASGSGEVEDYPITVTGGATPTPHLTLVKSASPATVTAAGDTVTYTFKVTNDGDADLTDVGVTESAFTGSGTRPVMSCPATTLAVGATVNCTATYVVTAADVTAGKVDNTAVAHGTPPGADGTPGGGTPIDSPPSSAQVTVPPLATIALNKTVSPDTVTAAGAEVTYTFHVENTSTVALSNVKINETEFTGSAKMGAISCPATTLAAKATMDCTAKYTVTAADVTAREVNNTAVAQGTPPAGNGTPGGGAPVLSPPASAQVLIPSAPALTLVKEADAPDPATAGDKVTYTFTVKNSGNVAMTGITIDDTEFTGSGTLSTIMCPETDLAVGESTVCTADYTLTTADLAATFVDNKAVARGLPAGGTTPVTTLPAQARVRLTGKPLITLVKSVAPSSVTKPGDSVTYTFTVKNAGDVLLNSVSVEETAFSGEGKVSTISCPKDKLNPGEDMACTANYTVTQKDINEAVIDNTAVAHAMPTLPGDMPHVMIDSEPSSAQVHAPATPGIELRKTADKSTVTKAGEKVTYTFHLKNTGNVPLSAVGVDEKKFTGSGALPAATCPRATLDVGGDMDCTATYTVTEKDVTAGKIDNTAAAHGTPPGPGSTAVKSLEDSRQVLTSANQPAIALAKTADPTTVKMPGDKVNYTFVVTNTGNVPLSNITIKETAFSGSAKMSAVNCPATTLAPGAKTTCTADYVATAADIAAGRIDNTAVATGTPPTGSAGPSPTASASSTASVSPSASSTASVSASSGVSPSPFPSGTVTSLPSSTQVLAPAKPGMELDKSADRTVAHPGDTITYSFTVKNTGNTQLRDVSIGEVDFTGSGTLSPVTCPATRVDAGTTMTCTATYQVLDADLTRGNIDNSAFVTGKTEGHIGVLITSVLSKASMDVAPSGVVKDAVAPPAPAKAKPLAVTGATIVPIAATAGALLLMGAGVLMMRTRTRRQR